MVLNVVSASNAANANNNGNANNNTVSNANYVAAINPVRIGVEVHQHQVTEDKENQTFNHIKIVNRNCDAS